MPKTERIPLDGGDWIDLATRVNHAQHRRIRVAYASEELDTITEVVAALAVGWMVHDGDGSEVPFPGAAPEGVTSASLDRFPADAVLAAFPRAAEIFHGGPIPNASAGKSGESPPAPESGSASTKS